MNQELKDIIDKYIAAVAEKVKCKSDAWFALARELFLTEGKVSQSDFDEILAFTPEEVEIDAPTINAVLTEAECAMLRESSKEIVDYCCAQYDSQPFTYNDLHSDSAEMAKLMVEIVSPKPGESIYLPFCGFGEVALNLPDFPIFEKVWADELHGAVWSLSFMRIAIHKDCTNHFCFGREDSFESMKHMEPHSLDLIIMSPPTGMDPEWMNTYLHVKAIQYAFNLLKESGRMIVALPAAYVHHPSTKELFGFLMGRAAFKSVRFVAGAGKETILGSNDFCILEICGNRQDEVTFIDGETSKMVRWNRIVPDNLHPSAYINNDDDYDGEYIRLGDCLELIETASPKMPVMPMVDIVTLTEKDYLNCKIDCKRLSYPTIPDTTYFIAEQRTLFINLWGVFLVGVFYPDSEFSEICWGGSGIIGLKIKDTRIMLEYLLRELLSERMQFRLAEHLHGKNIEDRLAAFLDIKIPLPPMGEQMKIVFEETRSHLNGAQASLVAMQDQHLIDIRLRKHTLISNVGAYRNQWHTLRKAFKRNGDIVDLRNPVSRTFPDNFNDWMNGMETLFEEINREIKVLTDDKEDFGKTLTHNPNKLIADYCDAKKQTSYRFTVVEETEPGIAISIPEKAIFRVFDNIVNNAISHGFVDDERDDYEIRFQTIATTEQITIIIANNGVPLSKGLQPEEVFELGRSTRMYKDTHGGQGGYDIRRILSQYDARVTIESYPDAQYTVVYKLHFLRYHD